jgi:hypothetical protein
MTISQFVGKAALRVIAFEGRLDASKAVTGPGANLVERVAALEKHAASLKQGQDFHAEQTYEAIEALYRTSGDESRAEMDEQCGALTQIVNTIQHKRWDTERAKQNGVAA